MNETTSRMVTYREFETNAILANAIQLGANCIRSIEGNEIADGVGGERMSQQELMDTLGAKINSYLMNPNQGSN